MATVNPPMRKLRRLRALAMLSMLSTAALIVAPGAAESSCVMGPPLPEAVNDAELVLVGTVVATANVERTATVSVEEVWKGPAMPARVQVKGGGDDPNTASSVDRTFKVGVRYLFFPHLGETGELLDTSCSSTQVWEDGLAVLRPADARVGQVDLRGDVMAFDLGLLMAIGGFVLLVAAVMLGVGLIARGRSD